MFPVEVAAARTTMMQGSGEAAVVPMMLPPFFMDSGDEAAAAAAAQDRALTASRNHREAEKRRRERIKSHLDRLRSIDKASLLAKAVERVRDLKQRMAGIGADASSATAVFPTEHDEIVVLASGGGAVFEASVCCDDRSDLLPELIETLRSLRLRTLRAEMATLGGRVRNVLVLARDAAGEDDEHSADGEHGGDFLKEALRALVERPGAAGGGRDRPKRRRVVSDMNM
uniref:BHLH domain-containing protein n=1 Tax=Leersia perrieri TaxID=77586 RepID=A0A0D9W0L2_9ORYZ